MIKTKFTRKGLIFAVAILPFIFMSAQAFGQSASLSGTVMDSSRAVLPGATITATNNATGVKTTITTNNAGAYNFAALPPGTYTVIAEMPGFQTMTRTDITLGAAAALRLNFEMPVAGVATQVEVSTSASDLLLESTPNTGTAMDERVVKELPLLGNDMMQLVNVMGGVVKPENTIFGNSNQAFAGHSANDVNITRDGITVNDVRYGDGLVSPGRISPEMVGEFKMILAPVDAEMGRGAGAVQILTKSGGNEYHGSGVWSNINTAMDANEWRDNRDNLVPMWKNVNQYTISGGGPIIRNKTFFFATWDHAIARKRETVFSNVLTPCARKGIYRYFPGWANGDFDDATSTTGNPIRPSVDALGNPAAPTTNPDGTPYTDSLHWGSVLGQLTPEAQAQVAADPINCSQYLPQYSQLMRGVDLGIQPGTNWDPYRAGLDQSGYIEGFTSLMPMPNYYNEGDGLNLAALKWTRLTHGEDTVYGSGMDASRKSISVKVDHNISDSHRLSGTYSYEKAFSDGENEPVWPASNKGYGGAIDRKPQTFTASLTSTLRPTLLNEFRFGLAYNYNLTINPYDNPATGQDVLALQQELLPTGSFSQWQGLPILVAPGGNIGTMSQSESFQFVANESHFYGGRLANPATWGSQDYRWSFGDTVTWTKGSHSLKFGAEVRLNKANSMLNGDTTQNWFPYVTGGNNANTQPVGLTAGAAFWPGLVGADNRNNSNGTYGSIYNLMDYFAGSIGNMTQYFYANDPNSLTWSDPANVNERFRNLSMNQTEMSFFLKDDWKVTSDLTLNLGLRYEYYGVPHMLNGLTIGVNGGAENAFGGQEGLFDQWLRGVPAFDPNSLTELRFIGPGSPNPDQQLFNKDRNNFGPAVGFAWQLPWFGKGKTTLRGGYQVNFLQIGRMDPNVGFMSVASGTNPGIFYAMTYSGNATDQAYIDLTMLDQLTPLSRYFDPSVLPLATRPLTDGSATLGVYDPNITSPYIQNLTLALTRQIGSSLTVDIRYIGTLSRKQVSAMDLNEKNWLHNGLKEAFDEARAGGESALLDTLMPPFSVWFAASGAAQLRTSPYTNSSLAQGNYNAIADYLATTDGLVDLPNIRGTLVRNSGLGENFILTNPQFSGVNYNTNMLHSNYHSLQGQVTLRPTHGLNFQATYTWSRNLGVAPYIGGFGVGNHFADPTDFAADYHILPSHRSHSLSTYGTYNLPLGPNGYVFRDSSGWVKKLVEGWQVSWISTLTSGLPQSISSVLTMYGGPSVDLVNPALFDTKSGHVTWEPDAASGRFWGDKYVQVTDPQCSSVSPDLQGLCAQGLKALALASDPSQIVFQHAAAGTKGNFDDNSVTGIGRWGLDMALSKNIEFMEGKSINFRVDVHNIFNHPVPSNGAPFSYDQRTYQLTDPQMGLNSSEPFGYIGYKNDHRVFSAKVRITF